MINLTDGLTFDDVLLQPKYSTIKSRSEVDLTVKLSKGLSFNLPVVPANMKTISGKEMVKCIADIGGLAILHRFMSPEEQLNIANEFVLMSQNGNIDYTKYIGYSVGVKKEDYGMIDAIVKIGLAKILCIDIAHGDSEHCVAITKYISEKYPGVFLIAGNVATAEGAKRLWEAGADCVKVGVGPGSLCSTRIETGNGVPQLTALSEVLNMKNTLKHQTRIYDKYQSQFVDILPTITKQIFIIADGGCKNSGDLIKSLCFADLVMSGNLFSGCVETPGDILSIDGQKYKNYVGSSTHKTKHIEGVAALVSPKGPVSEVMNRLCDGIKSGCSYQGVYNLTDLKKDPQFIRMTNAGLVESHPHDVKVTQ